MLGGITFQADIVSEFRFLVARHVARDIDYAQEPAARSGSESQLPEGR